MASATTSRTLRSDSTDQDTFKILLPYGLAILAQLPMLVLYFKGLWERPHYQFFPFAIVATVGLAIMRWPRTSDTPLHRSLASDILLILGLGSAIIGLLLVEPWFAAFSATMIVTSLLARTIDHESSRSLWPCALPLFICLVLPFNFDSIIITRLQAYSAQFTSQLLDLLGLGHHMDGTVINVPTGKQYGVEEACSGVVSFFTLIAITTAFIVWAKRVATPHPVISGMLIAVGIFIGFADSLIGGMGYFTLLGIGMILTGIIGFRSSLLLMSAVFWALFMNTIRILTIPVSEIKLGFDLSSGFAHDLLGYAVLLCGILLILSTDQFLTFVFGPVEVDSSENTGLQRPISNFWNSFLAGKKTEAAPSSRQRKKANVLKPITPAGRMMIWIVAAIMVVCGLFQLWDVKQSLAQQDLSVRFFDADVTMDFQQNDVPEMLGSDWKQVQYLTQDRTHGSDLGRRSDIWQFQSPRCIATASLDQTFPGWHELTTCYKNQGWNLVSRVRHRPKATEDQLDWEYIEARFQKETGEKGYLLFSHFDAFGKPVHAPAQWGSLNSLLIRAKNRLSNRVRATLFDGEVYQTQVFLTSFNPLSDDVKEEVKERYLNVREIMRKKFVEKRAAELEK